MLAALSAADVGAALRKQLDAIIEKMAAIETNEPATICAGLQITDTHAEHGATSETRILSVMLRDTGALTCPVEQQSETVRLIIIRAFRSLGAKFLAGAAPVSHTEDSLVQMLSSITQR
jgi:hypothetical protein